MRFYVYEHWRPDVNEPFYVGKGCGQRAYKFGIKGQRNLHHQAVEIKLRRLNLKIEVKIVARFATAQEAYAYEMERIAHWRALGMELVNRTVGGDGLRDPSPETRALISKWHKGRKLSDETRAKMRASQAKRPPQTPEQIEKARRNRIANRKPMRESTKALLSAARKADWEKIKNDPVKLKEVTEKRSAGGKRMWARLKAEDPERVKAIQAKRTEGKKASWTPETRAAQAEVTRALNRRLLATRGYIKKPFVGPKKPNYIRKDGPHGNKGKKMPSHVKAILGAISASKKGTKLPEATIQKMRDSWTPERRAKQGDVARSVLSTRERKPPTEAQLATLRANAAAKKGVPWSEETKAKSRASWTPERRAAQAQRCAERNRLRAAVARISKLPQSKTIQ